MTTNLLKLNSNKTELMVVAPAPLLRKVGDLALVVDGCSTCSSPEDLLDTPHTRLQTFGDRAFSADAPTLTTLEQSTPPLPLCPIPAHVQNAPQNIYFPQAL
ncbi:unnamed protein product [Leuciscus chuanchicus]